MRALVIGLLVFCLAMPAMAADTVKEMFTEGSFNGQIKLLSFTRDYYEGTTDQQSYALGGSFYYRTAPLKGISFGAAFSTTNNIDSPDDKNTYAGLLAAGQESVARMQEYYVQGDWMNTQIKIGAQEVNTPFLCKHDVRMMPRTFRGVSLVNTSFEGLKISAYYLRDAMDWDDENFSPISDSINSKISSKPVYMLGLNYKLPVKALNASVQGWGFSMPDVFNQTYFSAAFSKKIDNVVLHASPTFFTQDSQGDDLAGDLDTYQYGMNLGVSAYGFDLTGFYSKTGDDGIVDPWGYGKIIIQQVYNSGIFADQDAWAARLSYDFAQAGIKGLGAYVFYADYDSPGTTFDMEETDLSIQYAFSGALEGFSVRARHAIIDKESGEDFTDSRFYLMFNF